MIRNLALQHAATSCLFDHCLLCELGFLVDMLEKAEGQNCQATNFFKTLSCQSTAQSLNLLEERAPNIRITDRIQSLNRYLLDRFINDYKVVLPHGGQGRLMEHAVSTKMVTTTKCKECLQELSQVQDVHSHELIYPPRTMGHRNSHRGMHIPQQTFSQILKASVERQGQEHEGRRMWCSRCRKYQPMTQRRQVQTVPTVLMVNAAVQNNEAKHLWSTPNWLPQEIGVIVGNGQFFCYEGQDLDLHVQRKVHQIQVYELIGVVADVNSGENQKSHLVSMVNGKSKLSKSVKFWQY